MLIDLDEFQIDELENAAVRMSFLGWCEFALAPQGQEPAAHHRLLIQKLQDVADGKINRLMVFMPPGSAKSTYVSVLFPAWWFSQFPRSAVIAASHTAELAERFGRRVREMVRNNSETLGYKLSETNQAAGRWETADSGEYFAAGVGGSITGRRADLAVIDDPVASRADAESKKNREATWDWYRADLYTRLKPGARIVLVQTRWHQDDLGGRLLAEGDGWDVVNLPALAEPNDPLGREVGAPLWPEWEDLDALARKRKAVGERDWHALFQQRPRPAEGSILRSDWWQPWIEPIPHDPDFVVVSLDTAYTEKDENDPSACTVWYVLTEPATLRSKILLRYAWAERLEFPDLVKHLLDTVEHFGIKQVPLTVLVEAKASGLSVIQELRRRVPELVINAVTPRGDKVARAYAVTAMLEGGTIFAIAKRDPQGTAIHRAPNGNEVTCTFRPWAQAVLDECASFPVGLHDDLVDSTTQALRHLRDTGIELFREDEPDLEAAVRERRALFA